MLRDLEERLAVVLGSDLPAPLSGRVQVRPGSTTGDEPAAQVTVRQVVPVTPDFGAVRPELAPGGSSVRRIVRLEVEIDIRLTSGGNSARATRARALDDLIYFLDAPEFRSGAALRHTGDPGFLLERLHVVAANYEPDLSDPVAPDLTLSAVGWFWPVGQAGEDGVAIAEARIAQLVFPASTDPDPARFVAGGAEVSIEIAFTDMQLLSLRADGPGTTDPQRLAFQVLAPDGSEGQGSLTNGRNLGGGMRARLLRDAVTSVRYRPPAAPATDRLIVRLFRDGAPDPLGSVLFELPLITEAAP